MMTATINPHNTADTNGGFGGLQLLPITVNLLPEEVIAARAGRSAMRGAAAVLLAAVVGTGAWYYLANKDADNAATQLSQAQARAAAADKGKNGFTELNTVKGQIVSIKGQLAAATTGDVDWAKVNNSIRDAIVPNRVGLSGISDTATVSAEGAAAPTPGAGATASATGSVVITGVATSQAMVGKYATLLGRLPVLSDPTITSMSTDATSDTVQFSINANTTTAALNKRFQK